YTGSTPLVHIASIQPNQRTSQVFLEPRRWANAVGSPLRIEMLEIMSNPPQSYPEGEWCYRPPSPGSLRLVCLATPQSRKFAHPSRTRKRCGELPSGVGSVGILSTSMSCLRRRTLGNARNFAMVEAAGIEPAPAEPPVSPEPWKTRIPAMVPRDG